MLPDLALALRLQALDRKLISLESEIATLPKHVTEIQKKLQAYTRKFEVDKAALAANQRDRKKLEGDIQLNETKVSKLRGQLLEAKNNEQYRAFQNEIEFGERANRKSEDQIIVLMEQFEQLDKTLKATEADLKQQQSSVEVEVKRARDKTAQSQAELKHLQQEREALVAQMAPNFYTQYQRVRKKTKGTVVAEAVNGRCDACYISLRPQFFQDLRRGDQIMYCESCGRVLIYNPVIDVASDVVPATQAR